MIVADLVTLDVNDLARVVGGQNATKIEGELQTPAGQGKISGETSQTDVAKCLDETRKACDVANPGGWIKSDPKAGQCMLDNMGKCKEFK